MKNNRKNKLRDLLSLNVAEPNLNRRKTTAIFPDSPLISSQKNFKSHKKYSFSLDFSMKNENIMIKNKISLQNRKNPARMVPSQIISTKNYNRVQHKGSPSISNICNKLFENIDEKLLRRNSSENTTWKSQDFRRFSVINAKFSPVISKKNNGNITKFSQNGFNFGVKSNNNNNNNSNNKTQFFFSQKHRNFVKEIDRKRFSQFLKSTWKFQKTEESDDNLLGLDKFCGQKNKFEEKLAKEIKNQKDSSYKEISNSFINGKNLIQEKKLCEAYDCDLMRELNNREKNLEIKEKSLKNKKELLSEIHYLRKKQKFLYKPIKTSRLGIKPLRKKFLERFFGLILKNNYEITQHFAKLIVYPTKPYFCKGSFMFFENVKHNRINIVKEMLSNNKQYLLDFDHFYRTPMHWACYYGFQEMVEYFFFCLSSLELRINMKDIIGKTALFLACQQNHPNIAKILLFHGASPWSCETCIYNSENIGENCYEEIKKARKLDIVIKLTKDNKVRRKLWGKEASKFFL